LSAPTSQRRIVVADDHQQVLAEVVRLLQNEFDIVAAVGDGVSAVQSVADLKPNVVVLDIEMPLLNGFEVAQQINHMERPTKIVFFSIHEDSDYIEHAKTMGASYVFKSRMTSDLSLAINETLEGRIFVSELQKP
jgi:two-component system response regulator DegU